MSYPVALIGFVRPDLISRRLDEILPQLENSNPVYVFVDGPRKLEDLRWILKIHEIANIYSSQPNIKFVFRKKNLGCSDNLVSAVTEVCALHDGVIVVEDDVSISPQFLKALSEVLDSWNPSSDWLTVGGFSPFVTKSKLAGKMLNVWRKSNYFSAWGWGVTSKAWDNYLVVTNQKMFSRYLRNSEKWRSLNMRKQKIWLKRFERGIWDFQVQMMHFATDKYCLLPTLRIIDNEGFDSERSTHTRHKRPWNFFGNGYSTVMPKYPNKFSKRYLKIFWRYIDSNFWAADGLMNARARNAGVRTLLKKSIRMFKQMFSKSVP